MHVGMYVNARTYTHTVKGRLWQIEIVSVILKTLRINRDSVVSSK